MRKRDRRTGISVGLVLAATLGGCATPGPVATGPGVAQLQQALPTGEHPTVRWGGTITALQNTADDKSLIQIVSRPLRRNGRPRHNDQTDGRFLAEIDGFVDPAIIENGRDVTVVGEVGEIREGTVGQTRYRFPVVTVRDVRYWKPQPAVNPVHLPHPWPVSDYHDDFWHDWPHRAHHHKRQRQLVDVH